MHDDPITGREDGTVGCIVIVAASMLLGSALAVAGVLFGDLVAYNWRTGGHGTIQTTLYVIGGVFLSIGLFGAFILVAGRDKD